MKIKEGIKNNFLIIILFIISTSFFIFQHYNMLSWDFSSYVLNAKYLFYNGTYFEVYRAPMASFILGFFLLFKSISEYLYIIFVSSLFFYANIKLSTILFEKYFSKSIENRENIKNENKQLIIFVFYFFSLSYFVLLFGTQVGTELLGLAFFELFLAYFLNNKVSGHFLALAFLSRYNFMLFLPFLLLNKDYKKILKNILAFILVISPWLIFNYLTFGNFFTSIIDSYALNVFNRQDVAQQFRFISLLKPINWFLPLFLIGIFYSLMKIIKNRNKLIYNDKEDWLFFAVFLLIIYDFYSTPFKINRYLFNLSLPIAFFSLSGTIFLRKMFKIPSKIIIIIFLIIFLFTSYGLYLNYKNLRPEYNKFYDAAKDIKELNIENCLILSPHWVLITYFTENVYPLGLNNLNESINRNEIILIFYKDTTIDDMFNINDIDKLPQILKTNNYVFLGKKGISNETCSKKYVYNPPYVKNHCEIISTKFKKIGFDKLALKSCNLINP